MGRRKTNYIFPIKYVGILKLSTIMGLILIMMIFLSSSGSYIRDIQGQQTTKLSPSLPSNAATLSKASPPPASPKGKIPTIINKKDTQYLTIERVFRGISYPSSMAFLGPNDILVLEKANGTVMRIVNGDYAKGTST